MYIFMVGTNMESTFCMFISMIPLHKDLDKKSQLLKYH